MHDTIQEDLAAYQAGDREAGERALRALMQEWRPMVRRRLRNPGADEVDAWLQEMLEKLALPNSHGQIRALAPPGASSPYYWRARVLHRALIDGFRKKGRRTHLLQGFASGDSPATEQQRWRAAKEARVSREPLSLTDPVAPQAPPPASPEPPPFAQTVQMRRAVLKVVDQLVIRRRVILMLALRANPVAHAAELARELSEDPTDTEARMAAALSSRPDGTHKVLTMPMVRVPWPTEPDDKARESARKNLERAMRDVRFKLSEST